MNKSTSKLLEPCMDDCITFLKNSTKLTPWTFWQFCASASWTSFMRWLHQDFNWIAFWLSIFCGKSYFVILILSNVSSLTRRVPLPVILCTQYIACYFVELVLLIQVFEDVKKLSKNFIPRLTDLDSSTSHERAQLHLPRDFSWEIHHDESTELFLIQKLHQNFNFSIYNAENIDNTSIQLVHGLQMFENYKFPLELFYLIRSYHQ